MCFHADKQGYCTFKVFYKETFLFPHWKLIKNIPDTLQAMKWQCKFSNSSFLPLRNVVALVTAAYLGGPSE